MYTKLTTISSEQTAKVLPVECDPILKDLQKTYWNKQSSFPNFLSLDKKRYRYAVENCITLKNKTQPQRPIQTTFSDGQTSL